MVTGGVDLVTVAEILGHADIKMIMRYAHPTPENERKAVQVLASIIAVNRDEIRAGVDHESKRGVH